jgi:hypothetical protein
MSTDIGINSSSGKPTRSSKTGALKNAARSAADVNEKVAIYFIAAYARFAWAGGLIPI